MESIGDLINKLISVKIEVSEGNLKRKDLIDEIVRELGRRFKEIED